MRYVCIDPVVVRIIDKFVIVYNFVVKFQIHRQLFHLKHRHEVSEEFFERRQDDFWILTKSELRGSVWKVENG